MGITAAQVNELRKITGAGMMDCKKALVEAEGDTEKAVEILRKKGQKVSAKRADREANEGAIFAAAEAGNGFMLELGCETDFVARNDDFQNLGSSILAVAVNESPATAEDLRNLPLAEGRTVGESLTDAMGKIGEKIELKNYAHVAGDQVVPYIHPGARVAVLVAFEGGEGDLSEPGKNVAMQVAAMNPVGVDETDVPEDVLAKEREIGMEQARAEGKPDKILDKIADGKVKRFLKDNTLLHQQYVKDGGKTVAQYLKEAAPGAKVKTFKRFQLGQ